MRSLTRNARRGFTLVELIVVLSLLTIVGGSLLGVLAKQQRFFRGAADVVDQRAQLRQAAAILAADLRSVSSTGGDIVAMTDSSIDFRYTLGASVACVLPGGSKFYIPPLTLSRGNTLTTWSIQPAAGDSVWAYDDNSNVTASSDDTWRVYPISGVSTLVASTSCPSSTGLTAAADATSNGYSITLGTSPSSTIQVGAPLRFVRRAHYSLYKNTTDAKWYLGYCLNVCSATNTISPIAGPFNAYAAAGGGTSGIRFTFLDKTGATTTTAASVALISVVLRATPSGAVNLSGYKYETKLDSTRVNVAIRNRA